MKSTYHKNIHYALAMCVMLVSVIDHMRGQPTIEIIEGLMVSIVLLLSAIFLSLEK